MTDSVRLYIGFDEDGTDGYYLADEKGMAEALYVELSKQDAADYFRHAKERKLWQTRLQPLHAAAMKRFYADRDEESERRELARLKAKYGP